MAKKKEMSEEELQNIRADLLMHIQNTLVNAGASTKQIILIAQLIAMSITLDGVGTGAGSRQLLTDLLSGMHKAYLEEWEERVESEKKS